MYKRQGQNSCPELNEKVGVLDQNISVIEPVFDGNFAPPPPPPPPPPGDQLIYFVHGLGGTVDTWATASNGVQTNYQTTTLRPTYSEFSLEGAGIDLHNMLVSDGAPHLEINGITDASTSFLIGSSQGGIVSRAANKYYSDVPAAEADRMFGGIVTFGSAHQGARIINNIDVLQQLLNEGCTDLATPFVLGQVPQIALPLVNLTGLQDGVDQFCGVITGFIESQVFGQFLAPITEDYAVGAPELEALNEFSATSNIPKVAFYGVEEEPIFWRTMNYFTTDPNASTIYQANEDDDLMNQADDFILEVIMRFEAADLAYENELHNLCNTWDWITNPIGCLYNELTIDIEDLRLQRDVWADGLNYMLTLNDQYKIAIGALDFEPEMAGVECTCTRYDTSGPTGISNTFIVGSNVQCLQNNEAFVNCVSTNYYTFHPVEHPSDGVILASSAGDMPGGIVRPDLDREMVNTSHQQMRNNSELREKLEVLVFAGEVDDFFRIFPR